MKRNLIHFLLLFLFSLSACIPSGKLSEVVAYESGRPYTRWWWFASEPDTLDVKYQLEWLKEQGFGGVEIAWIYPMHGDSTVKRVDWLSTEWSEAVAYAKRIADALGLGCDFTYGTLWPFNEVGLPDEDGSRGFYDSISPVNRTLTWEHPKKARILNHLDKEVYRLNAQVERLRESIQNQIDYMWNEYEITLHDAAKLRDENMNDLSAMKKAVAELRGEIKKLGDVNVNAIEEYKEVSERYTFLKTQHDDLVEAEKTLVKIIEELDTAMRRQFKEKFHKINQEFDKVFRELFGGGKGTLELQEDEDILEAGIRIIAQPPGKKLQNMMQLSGGEKSLTAIALLFAIQNLKPSPFCLLDEIEAALDESNVSRFANYLHKLTRHTQFIVITHRRGTMEKADRLYGITMQEKGVSVLVSVNLVDDAIKN